MAEEQKSNSMVTPSRKFILEIQPMLGNQWKASLSRNNGTRVAHLKAGSLLVEDSIPKTALKQLKYLQKEKESLSQIDPDAARLKIMKALDVINSELSDSAYTERLLQNLKKRKQRALVPADLLSPVVEYRGKPHQGVAEWDQGSFSVVFGENGKGKLTPDFTTHTWNFRGNGVTSRFPFLSKWEAGVPISLFRNHTAELLHKNYFEVKGSSPLAPFLLFIAHVAETNPASIELALLPQGAQIQLVDSVLGLNLDQRAADDLPMNGSRVLLTTLEQLGVREIFGEPTGPSVPFNEDLIRHSDTIQFYPCATGACFAALGAAQQTEELAVCFCPHPIGACPAAAEALIAQLPMLCLHFSRYMKQLTELNMFEFVAAPNIVKAAWTAENTRSPQYLLIRTSKLREAAVNTVTASQLEKMQVSLLGRPSTGAPGLSELLLQIVLRAQMDKKPLVFIFGHELRYAGHQSLHDAHAFAEMVARTGISVHLTTFFRGKGALNEKHPLALQHPITPLTPLPDHLAEAVIVGLGADFSWAQKLKIVLPKLQFDLKQHRDTFPLWGSTLSVASSLLEMNMKIEPEAASEERARHPLARPGVAVALEVPTFRSVDDVWPTLSTFAEHASIVGMQHGSYRLGATARLPVRCGTVLSGKHNPTLPTALGALLVAPRMKLLKEAMLKLTGTFKASENTNRGRALLLIDTEGMQKALSFLASLQDHQIPVTIVLFDNGRRVFNSLLLQETSVHDKSDLFNILPTFDWEHALTLVGGGKRTVPFAKGGQAYAEASNPTLLAEHLHAFAKHRGPALVRVVLPNGSLGEDSKAYAESLMRPTSQ